MQLLRPRRLGEQPTIGVFTPSIPAHIWFREKYLFGITQLERLGFRVVEGPLTAQATEQGYRSGTPQERAAEFMALIDDPRVDMLMSAIGGMNSASMIPFLDFQHIRAARKIICGYSDVTSLHMAILHYAGLSTFYGPAVIPSFGDYPAPPEETVESFLMAARSHHDGRRELRIPARWSNQFRDAWTHDWQTGERVYEANPGWHVLNAGTVSAPIVVANLNTLLTAAGTPYFPVLDGVLLLIEDMAAPLWSEERALRQLHLMGVFDRIAGLLIGKPEKYDQQNAPFDYDALVMEIVGPRNYPIVSNVDCGHTHPMLTLAQMTPTTLSASGTYDVLFSVDRPMTDI